MLLVQFHCTITIKQEREVSAYSTHNILRSGLKIPDKTFFYIIQFATESATEYEIEEKTISIN